ncbi:MAG TPA: diguanylate cyclase [Longimicrobiales bacterium]|nr:diguanylate cyclase [Longimicrobiales bacterium]
MLSDPVEIIDAMARAAREIAAARTVAELEERLRPLGPLLFGSDLEYISGPTADAAGGQTARVESDGRTAGWLRVAVAAESRLAAALLDGLARMLGAALETIRQLERTRQMLDSLRVDREYFEQLFAAAPEAIVVLDEQDRVVRANREFEHLFGYSLAEAEGATINELIVPPNLQEQAIALTRLVAAGEQVQEEVVRRRKDGSLLHVSILGTPVVIEGDQVAVYGIYRDITVQKQAEEALRRLSTTDELTGLLNRRGFFLLAEQQRRVARRRRADLLLLYIDIDDFKRINDSFGHHEGDRVLADMGHLLRTCYRDSDIMARVGEDFELLARMGGDEFVVLAVDAGEQNEGVLTMRLSERLAEYNAGRPEAARISLSVGALRVAPEPETTIDALLAAADRLMYRDKRGPLKL